MIRSSLRRRDVLEGIELRHLPAKDQKVARIVGLQRYLALSDEMGGENLYIPNLEWLARPSRAELVLEMQEERGKTVKEIADEFGLTDRNVERILAVERERQNERRS